MITTANLRVVCLHPRKENKVQKFWAEITKRISFKIKWETKKQKVRVLKRALSNAFGEYDYLTQSVNLYPAIRAEEAVEKMIKNGTLNHYYKKLKQTIELRKKFFQY